MRTAGPRERSRVSAVQELVDSRVMRRRTARPDARSLGEEALAAAIEGGDEDARAEARRRFKPLAISYARRACSHLHHLGRRCPAYSNGTACDGAFLVGEAEMLSRIAGVSEGRGPDGTHRRARRALLVRWRHRTNRELTFSAFLASNSTGYESDVLRKWNVDRGFPARVQIPARLSRPIPLPEAGAGFEGAALSLLDVVALTLEQAGVADVAAAQGVGLRLTPASWLQALSDDACTTGTAAPITYDRVIRQLLVDDASGAELSPDARFAFEQAIDLVDEAVMAVCQLPALDDDERSRTFYDRHFSQPRQQTRQLTAHGDVLDNLPDRSARPEADPQAFLARGDDDDG